MTQGARGSRGAAKARRALAWVLVAAGCFGLGIAASRWAGWGGGARSQMPPLPSDLPPPVGTEPRIYIDAGAIVLYDGSLTLHPPAPPNIEEK